MTCAEGKGRENLFLETNCGRRNKRSPLMILSSIVSNMITKLSKDQKRDRKSKVTPEGCFPVYVGAARQRFVIKTEYANHPLFRMLLEDAEMEYGYKNEGPLSLPCEVDLLAEIEGRDTKSNRQGSFSPSFGSLIRLPGDRKVSKGSYGSLTPSPMLKMNGV